MADPVPADAEASQRIATPELTAPATAAAPAQRLMLALRRLAPDPALVFVVLLLVALLCRVIFLSSPDRSLIFDEVYYVNAARVILGWPVPQGGTYAGQPAGHDPNQEHPPLGKLLIAGSMLLFGDNAWGWRLPSILTGMAAIVLVYAIVRALGGDPWLADLAAGLFAFDNLVFVHSRIATLDMPLVALLLLGAWLALRGLPVAGAACCALAALVKLGAVYGLLALVLYEAIQGLRTWRRTRSRPWPALRTIVAMGMAFAAVWFGGLWLLDLRFSAFHTPWAHLHYMLTYGFSLARSGGPANSESEPWQWLINEVQIPYLRVDQQVSVNGQVVTTRPLIFFRGAMNPIIIGAAPLGISYALWRAWPWHGRAAASSAGSATEPQREAPQSDPAQIKAAQNTGLWVAIWFAATYLPFYPPAMIAHRISYIFYFLPSLPAVAIGLALLLREAGLPRAVLWGYLLLVLVGFIGYFPFQSVL